MTDIKGKVQGVDPNVSARSIQELIAETGNIYETLAIISNRARQVSNDVKRELHQKLEEYAQMYQRIIVFPLRHLCQNT